MSPSVMTLSSCSPPSTACREPWSAYYPAQGQCLPPAGRNRTAPRRNSTNRTPCSLYRFRGSTNTGTLTSPQNGGSTLSAYRPDRAESISDPCYSTSPLNRAQIEQANGIVVWIEHHPQPLRQRVVTRHVPSLSGIHRRRTVRPVIAHSRTGCVISIRYSLSNVLMRHQSIHLT